MVISWVVYGIINGIDSTKWNIILCLVATAALGTGATLNTACTAAALDCVDLQNTPSLQSDLIMQPLFL